MTHDTDSEQTVRAQLNEIADHCETHDEYPEDVSKTDVQELGQTLHDQLADRIETYVAETNFTRREAEVWALYKYVDEYNNFVTYDGATLLLSTPGTGFSETTEADEGAAVSQSVTSEDAEQLFRAAEEKVEDARQTVGAVTFPDRDEVLTSPNLVWLNHHTVQRLRSQQQSGETTLDDVATRILDETETQRSLEEFVHGYLGTRGEDNVTQLAVERESFKTGALQITSHTLTQEELPDIVTETDAIIHHGHRYDLHFHEDPFGPRDLNRLTLYAGNNIIGMDAVSLKEGLAAANEHMKDLLESDEPLASRTVE
ncbi:hypothetical protein M0R89_15480 [Halorussus limi]|uniref:Uncharacterized protein n=2 Tax=Halorussus TaxID=1070314 RepID=A0A8U0IGE4_9EURY|nr:MULTISPECIES: hypothetical protein [Halorussus]UPV73928.1 hypothetical protein M0R89_15480 [Halorussus limi]UPV99947.1 hypothetical protein M0R88_15700 [Halorussus gelatinilyticus]